MQGDQTKYCTEPLNDSGTEICGYQLNEDGSCPNEMHHYYYKPPAPEESEKEPDPDEPKPESEKEPDPDKPPAPEESEKEPDPDEPKPTGDGEFSMKNTSNITVNFKSNTGREFSIGAGETWTCNKDEYEVELIAGEGYDYIEDSEGVNRITVGEKIDLTELTGGPSSPGYENFIVGKYNFH